MPASHAPSPRAADATRGRFSRLRAIGIVVLVGAFGLAPSALARDRKDHTPQIRVSGSAAITAPPDRVSVDVSVLTRADAAQAAAERNAAETTALVRQLRKAFPEAAELSTSGYSLTPEYEYDKREGRRKPAGFAARNTVLVVLSDVSRAGALIDAAIAAGANEVRAVRFGIADSTALEQQALNDAAEDARTKAEALAASMGAKLGRTLRVEEHGTGPVVPHSAMMARAQSEATPIEPGDVYVEASVTLWVELVER